MTEEDHAKAPTTIREVGIHIGYMRDDISHLKEIVEKLVDNTPTRTELEEVKLRIDKLEMFVDSIKTRIAGWAVTVFVGMVLVLYGLDRFFRG